MINSTDKRQILFIRPEHDQATRYGSYWILDGPITAAKEKRMLFVDLLAETATKANVDKAFQEQDILLIVGVGHGRGGDDAVYTGHNNETIFDRSVETGVALRSRAISLLTCSYGQALPDLMHLGLRFGHLYKEDFYFVASIFPNSYAGGFMRSHMSVAVALIQGKIPSEVETICKDTWKDEMQYMDSMSLRYAAWDLENTVFGWSEDTPLFPEVPPPPEKFKCCVCGQEFAVCQDLVDHICFHHCEQPPQPKPCWLPKWLRNLLGCQLP